MPKVLLADTNVSSVPIYQYLINEGYDVFVVGGNEKDFLAKCATGYVKGDYSKVAVLEKICEALQIQYLVPGCNDISYEVCAELAERGKFFGFETKEITQTLNNKELFRALSEDIGIPVPKVWKRDQLDNCHPEVIVKPVDSYSGQGITVVEPRDLSKLEAAVKLAEKNSRTGKCVVEEFVVGQLYSHTAFLKDCQIVNDFIVEEYCTANPFAVDTSRVIFNLPIVPLKKVRESVEKIAKKLLLKDGLMHTQFIARGDVVWLVEVTRRCPGDLYSRLIEMTTDFSYAENYTRPFLNLPLQSENASVKKNRIMRHTISSTYAQNFWTLQFRSLVKVRDFIPLALAGDRVDAAPKGRIGIMFAEADSDKEFEFVFQKTKERRLYKIT